MTPRRSAPRRVLALLVVASACGRADGGGASNPGSDVAIRLIDASGRELALESPARRVVSLVPSATETLRAMGRLDVLIGRTDYDTASWVSSLPSVGGGLEPSLEAIVALQPDLVVRFSGEQDTRTPTRLDELGIAHLGVRPDRIEDIYRTADLLGRAIGATRAADSLVAALRARLDTAAASVRGLPRLRVAYVLNGTPPWVAGPGTYIEEVVAMMGGDNAFADLGALYAAVSPEQLRSRPIDVVLVHDAHAFDASLVPQARVEAVGGALDLPGPGVVDAAYLVGELLHERELR